MIVAQDQSVFTAPQLAEAFARNSGVVRRQVAGLTHDDSLRQPPMRGNCLNWVLGHIAVHRDYVLEALGQEKVLGAGPIPRYDRGSAPILADGDDVLPLDTLLAAIALSELHITEALAQATAAELAVVAPKSESATVAGQVTFLYWHETYHVGQTEYLRQLAGTNDHVI